jgi:outer membrane protein OmpA-like peptidoglycan-associated protein
MYKWRIIREYQRKFAEEPKQKRTGNFWQRTGGVALDIAIGTKEVTKVGFRLARMGLLLCLMVLIWYAYIIHFTNSSNSAMRWRVVAKFGIPAGTQLADADIGRLFSSTVVRAVNDTDIAGCPVSPCSDVAMFYQDPRVIVGRYVIRDIKAGDPITSDALSLAKPDNTLSAKPPSEKAATAGDPKASSLGGSSISGTGTEGGRPNVNQSQNGKADVPVARGSQGPASEPDRGKIVTTRPAASVSTTPENGPDEHPPHTESQQNDGAGSASFNRYYYDKAPQFAAVWFDLDSSDPSQGQEEVLSGVVRQAQGTVSVIWLRGHADNTGSAEHNLDLSRRRAESVERILNQLGVPVARMEVIPDGDYAPLFVTPPDSANQLNRRVDIFY